MYIGFVFGYYGVIEIKKVASIKTKGYALIVGKIGVDENWIILLIIEGWIRTFYW